MAIDRIGMINGALLRIGALPVIGEQDPAARQHVEIYDAVLADLASKPFDFFRITKRLVRATAAPSPAHYQYQFILPSDRIGPVRAVYADATKRQPVTDYDIETMADGTAVLLTDHPEIWATILRATDPLRWPGDFAEAFMTTLMAELALSVREDRALHDRLWTKARGTPQEGGMGGLMRTALENNNQELPSTVVGGGVNPLVDVR